MKRFPTRIDRYVLGESLPPLLFGLLLYAGLAVLSATLPRLQWIVGTPLPDLAGWLALQLPAALVQTLPIALVLAALLAFGRLSSARELIAMRAGAIPLGRAARVLAGLGVVATLLALAVNQWVLPVTNARVGALWWELTSGGSGLFRLAGQNLPVDDFTLRFERTDRATDELYGVRLERWEGDVFTVVRAERARFEDEGVRLFGWSSNVIDLDALDAAARSGAPVRLDELVRVDARAPGPEAGLLVTTSTDRDEIVTRFSGGGFEDTRSITGAWRDAHDPDLPHADRRRAWTLLHRRIAEPFANLVLLLVALPLSILYARSRSVAFGLSLVVTLAWYLLLTLGQLFAQTGAVPAWAGVWFGPALLAAVGLALLARVEAR